MSSQYEKQQFAHLKCPFVQRTVSHIFASQENQKNYQEIFNLIHNQPFLSFVTEIFVVGGRWDTPWYFIGFIGNKWQGTSLTPLAHSQSKKYQKKTQVSSDIVTHQSKSMLKFIHLWHTDFGINQSFILLSHHYDFLRTKGLKDQYNNGTHYWYDKHAVSTKRKH